MACHTPFKVAERSFQVPIPNSPLRLGPFRLFMLWRLFFARVKVNHRKVYSRILAEVCTVAMVMGLVKSKV